ncbi:MAG: biotin--[acetyl-CoA-carboxylase] ligase [Desulfatirhabdiaceae bacterium]
MKADILNILRSRDGVISGEAISEQLDISRVSVWKHIQKLQQSGYSIESTPKGYRLIDSPDIPYPWEFKEKEFLIHYFPEIESTMDTARDLAQNGCAPFTVVVADRQKNGRGRMKRVWVSEAGGLYMTIVLRPQVPLSYGMRHMFAVSVVLCRVIREWTGVDARVKWPNDILVDGQKLCGMLSEMETEADMVYYLNVGIGVNVNNDPAADEPNSCSLLKLTGRFWSRKDLLSRFMTALKDYLSHMDLGLVVSDWKTLSSTPGKPVRIVMPDQTVEGIARDIDDTGGLIIELADGTRKTILFGDCFEQHEPATHHP